MMLNLLLMAMWLVVWASTRDPFWLVLAAVSLGFAVICAMIHAVSLRR